jgi:hypothetical protein
MLGQRVDRLEIDPDDDAPLPDAAGRDLQPRPRRGPAVEHGVAPLQDMPLLVDLDQLVRRPRAVPLALRLAEVMIVDLAGHRNGSLRLPWPAMIRSPSA